MKYSLALIDNGAIVGRSNVELHPHGESTRVLKDAEPGIGRRGDVVRVAHPLEDPGDNDQAAAGVSLALVAELPDGDGGTRTVIMRDLSVADAEGAAVAELNQKLDLAVANLAGNQDARDKRIAVLETQLAELRAELGTK